MTYLLTLFILCFLYFLQASEGSNSTGISSTSGFVAVGTKKGYIAIWKLQTGEIFHKLGDAGEAGHAGQVYDLVFNSDGKLFVVSNNTLGVRSLATSTLTTQMFTSICDEITFILFIFTNLIFF